MYDLEIEYDGDKHDGEQRLLVDFAIFRIMGAYPDLSEGVFSRLEGRGRVFTFWDVCDTEAEANDIKLRLKDLAALIDVPLRVSFDGDGDDSEIHYVLTDPGRAQIEAAKARQ